MSWKVRINYPGCSYYILSEIEPSWKRVRKGDRVLHRLEITLPDERPDTYSDGYALAQPIYREHLANWWWEENVTATERKASTRSSDQMVILEAIADASVKFHDGHAERLINYGELRDKTGFGQKKLGDLLRECQAKGWTTYAKEGRMSGFDLTDPGVDQIIKERKRKK